MKRITDEMIKSFTEYLYREEKSSNTIEKYIRDIRGFIRWLGESEIDKTTILQYKKELCMNYAPRSVNSMLSSLNALFEYLKWYELKVKTLKIQRQIFADKNKELTKAEYERLLKAAKAKYNQKLYYILLTIAGTGIRISELEFIDVDAIKTGETTINCKGKLRRIFLPKALCKMLLEYTKKQKIREGSVFVSKSGKPINRTTVWRLMKNLCKLANVSSAKVFPHNLRHLFARTYYSLQKDIVRLADILGHSNINTTRIYTIETGNVHKRQIERLGLLRC